MLNKRNDLIQRSTEKELETRSDVPHTYLLPGGVRRQRPTLVLLVEKLWTDHSELHSWERNISFP